MHSSHPNNYNLIFDTLHWHLKKIFRDGDDIVDEVNDKISNFNEDRYTTEKNERLLHSHGQTSSDEVYKVLYSKIDLQIKSLKEILRNNLKCTVFHML